MTNFDSDSNVSLDSEVEDDFELDEEGSGSIARINDGSGYLILGGDRSGTVVESSEEETTVEVVPIPTRDETLAGDAPIFLVHRPHQNGHLVHHLLGQIHAAAHGNVSLGYVSKMSLFTMDSHVDFSNASGAASLRIIDPEGYLADQGDLRLDPPSQRGLTRSPHLDGRAHDAPQILDNQRERGANLLLSSGSSLNAADPVASLDKVFDEGDSALANLNNGERLALNITMSQSWLTNANLCNHLLDQLLDQEQFDVWYIRVQWRNLAAHAQPVDASLLEGYKRLCQLAQDEGRRLLLPQTGLTGWLMLGFGASGFGTGIGGSSQAFKEPQHGGTGAPQIERFFENQILHTIERSSRTTLALDPSYSACRCTYCVSQAGRTLWSHELANLHSVLAQSRLTSAAGHAIGTRGGLSGQVRRTIRSAVAMSNRTSLTGLSEPKHLRVWDRLI